MDNDKKVMIVTGASTGVGRATALRFAEEGYTVYALARSADKLAQLSQNSAGNIIDKPTDVSDSQQVQATFDSIIAEQGRIDVLVNNAGVTTDGQPVDFQLIDRIIDVNLKGTMYCTYATLPIMQQQGEGRIINVASIAGVDINHFGGNGLYTASKHGMVAFSEAIGKKVRTRRHSRDGFISRWN